MTKIERDEAIQHTRSQGNCTFGWDDYILAKNILCWHSCVRLSVGPEIRGGSRPFLGGL